MKKALLTVALVGLTAVVSYAQGTVQFLNSALSPVYFWSSPGEPIRLAPSGTFIGLYWGTNPDNLSLAGTAQIGGSAGIFNAGVVYTIPGTSPGQRVFLQIKGWVGDLRYDFATWVGQSTIVEATLGPTAGPGTVIWQSASGTNPERMKPFTIGFVPEPSVAALGALGLGMLLLWRRKA